MFKNVKWLAAVSLTAMVVSGCTTAPAPWANPNQHRGNVQPPVSVQGGTAHQHGTVVHTHPLPAQGIHHTHQYGSGAGIAGRAVGSAGQHAQPAPVRQPTRPQPQPQQNQSQTYGYGYDGNYNAGSPYDGSGNPYNSSNSGYGGNNNNNNNSSGGFYGDIGNNNNSSSYGSGNYGSSSSYGSSNYGSGSSSSGGSSYDNSSSYDTSTYGGSSSSSSSSSLDDIRDPNYRDGDTYYSVQKGNTVFAVMRITGAYWKDIVKWNDLEAPKYTIHPGQRLRVK